MPLRTLLPMLILMVALLVTSVKTADSHEAEPANLLPQVPQYDSPDELEFYCTPPTREVLEGGLLRGGTAPSLSYIYPLHSGVHDNPTDEPQIVFSHTIRLHKEALSGVFIDSTDFHLAKNDLKKGAYRSRLLFTVTNRKGEILKPVAIRPERDWRYLDENGRGKEKLAFFQWGGGVVNLKIELEAAPNTHGNYFQIESLGGVGSCPSPQKKRPLQMIHIKEERSSKTFCPFGNEIDDRLPSDNPAVALLKVVWPSPPHLEAFGFGTAAMVDCPGGTTTDKCFVSAGHTFERADEEPVEVTVSFDVPDSDVNCVATDAAAEDIYKVDLASLKKNDAPASKGNDWAVFRAKPTLGQTAFERQHAVLTLHPAPLPDSGQSRLTGNGIDSGSASTSCTHCDFLPIGVPSDGRHDHTQQTASGPLVPAINPDGQNIENVIAYEIDACGGNSGSPVIAENTCRVLGIHTNSGCQLSNYRFNLGTAITHPDVQVALARCGDLEPRLFLPDDVVVQSIDPVDTATLSNGDYLTTWSGLFDGDRHVFFQIADRSGTPRDNLEKRSVSTVVSVEHLLAEAFGGGFWILWKELDGPSWARRYANDGESQGARLALDVPHGAYNFTASSWSDGGFVAGWLTADSVRARVFGPSGEAGPLVPIASREYLWSGRRWLATVQDSFFTTWFDHLAGDRLFLRGFHRSGIPKTAQVWLGADEETYVSSEIDGADASFLVVKSAVHSDHRPALLRRYDVDAQPLSDFVHIGIAGRDVRLSSQDDDAFAILWNDQDELKLQPFSADFQPLREAESIGFESNAGKSAIAAGDGRYSVALSHSRMTIAPATCGTSSDPSSCATPSIFADGFESGDLRRWN